MEDTDEGCFDGYLCDVFGQHRRFAQQGTCSSYFAGCTQICQSVRNGTGCEAICNNLRSTCMQTGTWQKRDGTTVSNLHRQ